MYFDLLGSEFRVFKGLNIHLKDLSHKLSLGSSPSSINLHLISARAAYPVITTASSIQFQPVSLRYDFCFIISPLANIFIKHSARKTNVNSKLTLSKICRNLSVSVPWGVPSTWVWWITWSLWWLVECSAPLIAERCVS